MRIQNQKDADREIEMMIIDVFGLFKAPIMSMVAFRRGNWFGSILGESLNLTMFEKICSTSFLKYRDCVGENLNQSFQISYLFGK